MLVSLAIVGMVAVIVMIGVGRMGHDLGLSSRADRQIDAIAAAQGLLRHRIAVTFPAKDPQTGTGRDFAGQQTTLEFIAPAPDSDGPGELQRYRLKLAPDGTLTLYQISTLTTAIDARQRGVQGWLATPLLSGVTDLDLRYYGPREDTGASGWQPDWLHRLTLPVLVRVHVAMADASARAWPDLTIRVRAATIDSCERDFKTDQCKGTT